MNELGNVRNGGERNGYAVVGDGMFRSSTEISRETSAAADFDAIAEDSEPS